MGVVLLRLSLKETVRIFEINSEAVSLVDVADYIVTVVLVGFDVCYGSICIHRCNRFNIYRICVHH